MSNPYAYYNGKYCCNENEEKPNGTESQIEDGTCDGLDFNRKSECCSGDIYNTNNAYDNSAGMYSKASRYADFGSRKKPCSSKPHFVRFIPMY